MIIIVGLGNPGEEYEQSRHNVGFKAVDTLQSEWRFSAWSEKKNFKALVSEGMKNGKKVLLVKPLTFMNLSGEAVQSILAFYKEKPSSLVVIYDDIDLPLGALRIRKEGSSGTHNGMRSMVQHLTTDFARIRIGIDNRTPDQKEQQELADYVLGRFGKSEQPVMTQVYSKINEAMNVLLEQGIEKAMDEYNKKTLPF